MKCECRQEYHRQALRFTYFNVFSLVYFWMLASYKALQVPAKHSTPLIFWRENKAAFPLLSEVARRVLCISASSAQSERDFSSVGCTITDAEARLSPSTV